MAKKRKEYIKKLTHKNLNTRIMRELRWIWLTEWEPRKDALKKQTLKSGHIVCEYCGKIYTKKQVQVDHIIPVKSGTWGQKIQKLFSQADAYQVLCNKCHIDKTRRDNAIAKSLPV